jgi:hypothetical protein
MSTNARSRFLRPAVVVPGVVALLAGLAWLAFGYFGIHTAFIDERVDEAAPVFDATPAAATEDGSATDAGADGSADPTATTDEAAGSGDDATDDAAGSDSTGSGADTESADTESADTESAEPAAEPATEPEPEIVTELTGTFVSEDHPTSGTASVLGNGTGQRFLRFEGFETDNGPDLNVYLFDDETGEFVDLGDLKGNIGDQNYEVPAVVDLSRFDRVSIWCVRFGVGFGSATLMPAA